MSKRRSLLIVSIGLLLLTFLLIYKYYDHKSSDMPTVTIGNTTYKVDIADTPQETTQGLSGRKSMPKDEGMLFIFGEKRIYSFWMKEMNFPLDIIWIDGDKIVDISENVPFPQPGTPLNQLPYHSPNVPIDKVLEVNAGEVERKGIEVGDEIIIN